MSSLQAYEDGLVWGAPSYLKIDLVRGMFHSKFNIFQGSARGLQNLVKGTAADISDHLIRVKQPLTKLRLQVGLVLKK